MKLNPMPKTIESKMFSEEKKILQSTEGLENDLEEKSVITKILTP